MKHGCKIRKVVLAVLLTMCFCGNVRPYQEEVITEDGLTNRVKRAAVASDLNVTLETGGEWVNVSDIRISDKLPFNLTINVPTGVYQMTSSILTSEIMSVCSVSVISIGSNFAGIQAGNFSITFDQDATHGTQQSYKNYNVTIDFGTIENDGSSPNDAESGIVVQFDVIVVNSTLFTHGSTYMVFANVSIDSYTEAASVLLTGIEQSMFSITPPIANVSSPGPVDLGDIANWTVTLDLTDAVNKIQVNAWVNGTYNYPVCDIFVGEIGPAFSCFEKESGKLTKLDDRLAFEIPTIINTDFNKIVTAVNDTLLEIIVLARVPVYVTMSDSLFLNIEILLDDKLVFPLSEPIATAGNTLQSPGAAPQIWISTFANVNTVAIGSAIVFIIDVETPPGSVTIYDVTITTDVGVVTICEVQLMRIGDYLCMEKIVNATYTSSTSNCYFDNVDVPVGSVPNLNGGSIWSNDSNKFQLEVAVCVQDYSTVTAGDTLTMEVNVYYDPVMTNMKVTETLIYTIASSPDPLLATGNISLSNASTVTGYIGQTVDVNITAIFEQTTDSFVLRVSVPVVNDSSLAFVESATLTRIGSELTCLENRTLTLVSNETVSYSQTVLLVYDVGPVTYTGMTERNPFVQSKNSGENELEFTVTILVADHVENIQGSLIPINVMLEGATGLVTVGVAYIEVQITAIEAPQLMFIFTMEQFNHADKVSGDNVTCSVILYLKENSTAHAQNVDVHVMAPYYLGYGSIFDVHDADISISNLPEPGLSFSISEIDFKDNVSFSFILILDPARQLPMGLENFETVLAVDTTWSGQQRPDRLDTGTLYTEPIVFEFGFNTELPSAIGMENGVIQNCQITASSYLETNKPEDARLNTGLGWKPSVRGTPFCEEYITINSGTPAYITGLRVQSTIDSYLDIVMSFNLQYSDDDIVWYDVMEEDWTSTKTFHINVTAGGSISDVYEVDLNETERFTAQYIRLVSRSCIVGVRLELNGLKQSGPAVDCATVHKTPGGVPEQSYVLDGTTGKIFVCGLQGVNQDVFCSSSEDNGVSWTEIENNIKNIVALISNTSIVIGKANDNVTLLVSEDGGDIWETITDEYFTELQSMAGYTVSKDFPYEDSRGQSYNSMYTAHGMDGPNSMSLTGTMSGISVIDGGSWSDTAWWGTEDWNLL